MSFEMNELVKQKLFIHQIRLIPPRVTTSLYKEHIVQVNLLEVCDRRQLDSRQEK